jgi:hypothetical protein
VRLYPPNRKSLKKGLFHSKVREAILCEDMYHMTTMSDTISYSQGQEFFPDHVHRKEKKVLVLVYR